MNDKVTFNQDIQGKGLHINSISSKSFRLSTRLTSLLGCGLSLMVIGCRGGEVFIGAEPRQYIQEPMGGEPMGGEPMGGEPMGGEPMGGEPMGGEPMGGEPMGGEPMGGEPVEDCGLYGESSMNIFSGVPLRTLATQCATSGCHTNTSFRQFKLSFNAPEGGEEYSNDQIIEGLSAVEPFVTVADGTGSQLSRRMIDGHSDTLDFDASSEEYQRVVEWITNILACSD